MSAGLTQTTLSFAPPRTTTTPRVCCHADGRCLDHAVRCEPCDSDGYPTNARRRLKRLADDTFQDLDDQQVFRRVKSKSGDRLLPVFSSKIVWKDAAGFAAMLLLLSCLGAEKEYVLWDADTQAEMSEKGWMKRKYGTRSTPSIWHRACGETVTSTMITNLKSGHSVGCRCRTSRLQHWRHRRAEIVKMGEERGFTVVTTEEDWLEHCDGKRFCPVLKCNEPLCGEIVKTTSIHNLKSGHSVGCSCRNVQLQHWRHRRAEIVKMGEERGFTVVTTEEDWLEHCDGASFCPVLRCKTCGVTVTTTCIHSLTQNQGIGCTCRNKTERKLFEWLQTRFPTAVVTTQYRGPTTACGGQTHFDFHLSFPDGLCVLLELDGPQHFWRPTYNFDEDISKRDLLKEEFAIQRGLCVVRVLQTDVWDDRYGWQGWLVDSVAAARTGDARVFTPDAPAYRSRESAYVRAHAPLDGEP